MFIYFLPLFRKKEIFIALKEKQGKIKKNMCGKLLMAGYGKLCRQNRTRAHCLDFSCITFLSPLRNEDAWEQARHGKADKNFR